jgi:ATP-dependent DNA helicase RecG
LKDHGVLSRGEIDKLLWNVISDQLDDTQKKTKIGNILRKLRKDGIMQNETKGNVSNWSLVK